jgi:hypothetical protein
MQSTSVALTAIDRDASSIAGPLSTESGMSKVRRAALYVSRLPANFVAGCVAIGTSLREVGFADSVALVPAYVGGRYRLLRERGLVDPISIIAGVTLLGLISAQAYAYWPAMYSDAAAKKCLGNMDAIAAASEMYLGHSPMHTYPATQAVATATFTDGAGVNLLPSKLEDPADPTGTGTYSYTNTSANGLNSWIASCPGVHPASALQGLDGWKLTSTTIFRSLGDTYTQ